MDYKSCTTTVPSLGIDSVWQHQEDGMISSSFCQVWPHPRAKSRQLLSNHRAIVDSSSKSDHVDQARDSVNSSELLIQGPHLLRMRRRVIAPLAITRFWSSQWDYSPATTPGSCWVGFNDIPWRFLSCITFVVNGPSTNMLTSPVTMAVAIGSRTLKRLSGATRPERPRVCPPLLAVNATTTGAADWMEK